MDKLVAAIAVAVACFVALPALGVLLSRHPVVRRTLGALLLAAYTCAYTVFTFYGRTATPTASIELQPLWSWRASLTLAGGSLAIENPGMLLEIVLNVLLYLPLGCLLPLVLDGSAAGGAAAPHEWASAGNVAAAALACSVLTELAQALLHIGLCELDDVLHNTLGALVGFALYRAVEYALRCAMGERRTR